MEIERNKYWKAWELSLHSTLTEEEGRRSPAEGPTARSRAMLLHIPRLCCSHHACQQCSLCPEGLLQLSQATDFKFSNWKYSYIFPSDVTLVQKRRDSKEVWLKTQGFRSLYHSFHLTVLVIEKKNISSSEKYKELWFFFLCQRELLRLGSWR